ncbi:hypothetical protein CBR_g11146 [Chara braunii]|uniref:Uncharacterized protein n=1 Tax=Chara braunii TaxID=69332 RepID=A0A388KQ82_CHABU|nr:hypothetical protein CBR_g11146 [Chara braunii]|eukprot:GBG72214.1 hypothetical protein CBR_g11146 [Chara braunii]
MTFFLTSVYDGEGKNWVKEDKKVSLDLRLFQGYGVKVFSMKAFDVRGNGTEFRMLPPEQFLSKTNGYRTLPTPVLPSARQGRDAAEQSSEATDYDDGALRHLASPQHRSRGGTSAFDEEECEGQEGEGGGEEGVDGNEEDAEGEDNDMNEERDVGGEDVEDNRFSQCERRLGNNSRACCEDDAYGVGDADGVGGQPAISHGMSQSYNQAKDERDKHGSRGKRKRGEASTSPASQTKQARTNARVRTQELRDSGDEGEGVAPRMPEDVDELVQRTTPLDTTRCFFLEYDEQGFARQDVHVVNVAVRRIKRNPRGRILHNHRSLSEKIVRVIENVIESSITADPGAWDRPELILAPVDPNGVVDGQGRRITPDEFFQRDSAEFDWYVVCGQHTAEDIKRLVAKDSAAVKVYGLKAYSKVCQSAMAKFRLTCRGGWRGACQVRTKMRSRGRRSLYHCIYARDGPKGSTVSWNDLCPSYFKNFEAMICPEREVTVLLLMKEKVVATNVKVTPSRVNTECLLDIMRKERYTVRMFNYVVFRTKGRADEEWNDDFFMSYKDLEERYAPNGLCAGESEKEWEKLHSNKVKTVPRQLGGVEEARQGAGLGPTKVMYKKASFHFKVFIYTVIDKLDLLRAEVKRIASSARHLVWDKLGRQTTLLPVCIGSSSDVTRYDNIATTSRDFMTIVLHAEGGDLKNVTVATRLLNALTEVHVVEDKFEKCQGKHGDVEGDESVAYSIWEREPDKLRKLCTSFVGEAEGVLLLGRAHTSIVWEFMLAGDNVIACDESAKDIAYFTKFIDILVKDDRFNCRLEKPRSTHRNNRDMYHKLGPKRLKVWEYLFRDAPEGRLDGRYIYKKAKVTNALKHYHRALTGAFEKFVARCGILKFDLHKDQLTFKDNANLAKSGEGFNLVDSEEDSSDSEIEIENDTNAAAWRGQSAAMERDGREYGPGRSEGCSNPSPTSSIAPMVDQVECTPIEDDEDDEIDIPDEATKLAPGNPIPPNFCVDPNSMCFLEDKYGRTSEDKWGHDIIWHDDILKSCIQGGEWKMAVKYVSGWRPFARMGKDNWLKTTEVAILCHVRKENPRESDCETPADASVGPISDGGRICGRVRGRPGPRRGPDFTRFFLN